MTGEQIADSGGTLVKGHCAQCGEDGGFPHRPGCPVLGDPVQLAAWAVRKRRDGLPMTDDEVGAAAKVLPRLAKELAHFGPRYSLVTEELRVAAGEMQVFHERRKQERREGRRQSGSAEEASPAEASTASNPHNPHRGEA